MEFEKDNIEVLETLKNGPGIPEEDLKLAGAVQRKKHSRPKKKESSFLYGNEVAEVLKSANPAEQKLAMVADKYSEMLHTNRKLMLTYKVLEEKISKLHQDYEQCQQQRTKAILARSRLENLCRELQKLNKAQKEEIDLKLRLEEEKRKELSATFQSAFAEMNTLTNQNTEKNTKMREENLEMREKIKSVRDRIELSEQQLEKVRQQAQLELQLAEAKMATVKMEMTAEKECLLKEKQQLLIKLTEYQVRISELQAVEVGLRGQITMYTEKYDDFQNALTKSNEVFSGFNEEMERMSKKILKLEKETSLWKQRWEKSHAALLDMAAEKQARDVEMGKLNHKLSLLQELCKAFQRERTELLAQVRANSKSSNDDDSQIANVNKHVEKLSKDCEKLKETLAHLQGSETLFENDEQVTKDSAPPEKTNETQVTEIKPVVETNVDSPVQSHEDLKVEEGNVDVDGEVLGSSCCDQRTDIEIKEKKVSTLEPTTLEEIQMKDNECPQTDELVCPTDVPEENQINLIADVKNEPTINELSEDIQSAAQDEAQDINGDAGSKSSTLDVVDTVELHAEKNDADKVSDEKRDGTKNNNSGPAKKGNGKRKKK